MRRKRIYKKFRPADARYKSAAVRRFINFLMWDGKKSVAEAVLYDAFDIIKKTTKEEPLTIFEKALENAMPAVEVASKRVGGANYQVPREVRPDRKFVLACRWMISAARDGKGKPMAERLATEIMAAAKNEGAAIKKKQDV